MIIGKTIGIIRSHWRLLFVLFFTAFIIFSISLTYSPASAVAKDGSAGLAQSDFDANDFVSLDGQWEFYWDRLLTPADFEADTLLLADTFMKVPGSWGDANTSPLSLPGKGVATYRLVLEYPDSIKDPALRIDRVSAAYNLYANGQLIASVGNVSDNISVFEGGYRTVIAALPTDNNPVEIIIQVANLDYSRGGLRVSPVFGPFQLLERQAGLLFALQLFLIGAIFVYGIHYFILFFMKTKDKMPLYFSLLCLITALRACVWGETPLLYFFPDIPVRVGIYINYFTEYNLVLILVLCFYSIYPLEFNKTGLGIALWPTVFFNALLLTTTMIMAEANKYFLILMVGQMLYLVFHMCKAVLHKKENAILLLAAVEIFVLSIFADLFSSMGNGRINLSYIFLIGSFAVILALSIAQARLQANTQKKLVAYNEMLLESDRLKDRIMETEMSFLQAQIKPHFLYNALSAIANVCEKDGQQASRLILDLAIYLRGSLVFNQMDKISTIEKELEFVDTYFHIEKARFGDKIHLVKEISIPLCNQIPVLILQPLVENAVRHGISKKPGGGTVYLRMKTVPDGIDIEIEDDGIGIESDKLQNLLLTNRKQEGVGILNIHSRLLRLYGQGLTISSAAGTKTCVHLLIPTHKGEKK